MISFVRIDNRLIHGQVVEAWLPTLLVKRVVVADDEAAASPLIRAAMGLAVQSNIEVVIGPLREVNFQSLTDDAVPTLVLFRDISGAVLAKQRGLGLSKLNLGNVHFSTTRKQVSPSVFLSGEELGALDELSKEGVQVEVRAVPAEKAISLPEMHERFGKGS